MFVWEAEHVIRDKRHQESHTLLNDFEFLEEGGDVF